MPLLPVLLLLAAPEAPPSALSKAEMRNLQKQAEAQVGQCWHVPRTRFDIATTVRARYNRDGTLVDEPQVIKQTTAPEYYIVVVREIAQRAKRAVALCAPIRLPADRYDSGWEDIELTLHSRKQ